MRPDLSKDTNEGPVKHVGLEEVEVRHVGVTAFVLAHLLDVLKFKVHERAVAVAFTMDKG